MSNRYDILLKGGIVVDPLNSRTGPLDVGIAGEQIAEVGPDLDSSRSRETVDVKGLHVLPGLIDPHVHVSSWLGGGLGHRMMALAGVTTALDMAGPVDSVLQLAREHGAGLSLAALQYVRPNHTVRDANPGRDELEQLLQRSLKQGAIGLKILGGHYPLAPEATARAIEVARNNPAYLAFHAGSLQTRSNLDGLLEAISLAGGRSMHLAHINSYCRGALRPYAEETEQAVRALELHPNIRSESYLSPYNGTSAACADGVPESRITAASLEAGGFPATERGLEEAVLAGWAWINVESGGQMILASGEAGMAWWRRQGPDTTVSFPVNPELPRLRLATARRATREFVVDCIGTDGGGIPRNVTVQMGLALVRLAALSLEDFVLKTSGNPALILGLKDKGHLGDGADADVTVVDLERQRPVVVVAGGRLVMYRGLVCGSGTRMITTPAGAAAVQAAGLRAIVVDPERLLPSRPAANLGAAAS